MNVTSLKFYNGIQMPIIGLGTWQSPDEEVYSAVNAALEAGYRLIDTAFVYRNEAAIGKVLKKWLDSKMIKRDELFIVTKLPIIGMRPDGVEKYIKISLDNLQLEYIDLYLVHIPVGAHDEDMFTPETVQKIKPDTSTDIISIWKELEKQVDIGRTRSLGLSNFNSRQIARISKEARIKPCNLQIELNVYFQQRELVAFCRALDITVCAYAPIGSPGFRKHIQNVGAGSCSSSEVSPLQNPVVIEISKKYNKSPANILLRHIIQRGIAVIPKSTNPQRIKENFQVFDFELADEDNEKLDEMDKGPKGRCFWMDWIPGMRNHPEYPFKDRY